VSPTSTTPPAVQASGPLSDQQLAEIAARAAAATKGPWSLNGKCASNLRDNTSRPVGELICGDADQDFIVHAREDVPALLAEIDRLRARVAAVRAFAASHEYRWLHELLDGGAA
jgi:hypothetical protein